VKKLLFIIISFSIAIPCNDGEVDLWDECYNIETTSYLSLSNSGLSGDIPSEIGNLTNLILLDLGYNQFTSVPESIGNLQSLEYLYLFNNQFTYLPESICSLQLDWDGISPQNYPYFASGGNYLCDSELIPDCVEHSAHFEISLSLYYYSFLVEAPQECIQCEFTGDINNDYLINILDVVLITNCILLNNCDECSDINGDGNNNILDIVVLVNMILNP